MSIAQRNILNDCTGTTSRMSWCRTSTIPPTGMSLRSGRGRIPCHGASDNERLPVDRYVHIGKGNLLSEVRKNGYARALVETRYPVFLPISSTTWNRSEEVGRDRYQLGTNSPVSLRPLQRNQRRSSSTTTWWRSGSFRGSDRESSPGRRRGRWI